MPYPSLELSFENFSLMAIIGPFCVPLLFTITLPLIVVALVAEKASRMRQVMVTTSFQPMPYLTAHAILLAKCCHTFSKILLTSQENIV